MERLEAITFDYWNTLVFEERGHLRGRRISAWMGILEEAGLGVPEARLGAAFDTSWESYVKAWTLNRQYQATEAIEEITAALDLKPPEDVRAALHEAFRGAAAGADLRLTDGVEDCLTALKGAGVRLAIVCDVGMTPSPFLRDFLSGRGLLRLFDHWSFSDEVGAYKPSPLIFRHALEGLGSPAPARVAHVGDIRRTDVAGARSMGMVAVRYTGVFDDDGDGQPEADRVIASLRELPGALDLG